MFLNTSYKIYAKAFQLHLRPLLMEVINRDQTTFIPFIPFIPSYILDNVFLA
jgi:hypothetical protein